jgi:hypothetical protein
VSSHGCTAVPCAICGNGRRPGAPVGFYSRMLPELRCDLCGRGLLGLFAEIVAEGVLYCPECSREPKPLPRESWWLRALRWLAKL